MNIRYLLFAIIFITAVAILIQNSIYRKVIAKLKEKKTQHQLVLLLVAFIAIVRILYPKISDSIGNFRKNI